MVLEADSAVGGEDILDLGEVVDAYGDAAE
jgi:hypothetical protein